MPRCTCCDLLSFPLDDAGRCRACAEAQRRFHVETAQELRLAVTVWLATKTGKRDEAIAESLKVLEPIQHIPWVGELVEELRKK
jgi:hypothetical protein